MVIVILQRAKTNRSNGSKLHRMGKRPRKGPESPTSGNLNLTEEAEPRELPLHKAKLPSQYHKAQLPSVGVSALGTRVTPLT